jgi:hypothetical protein
MNHRPRLRRPSPASFPVAADVLEVRALLSSAASAAHAAVHHAELHSSTRETGAVAPPGFHAKEITAQIVIQTGQPQNVPVKFSLSRFNPVEGAKVTAHASASVVVAGNKFTLKATFVGTIHLVEVIGNSSEIAATPTGGSIAYSMKGPSGNFKATALPDGFDLIVDLNGGNFTSFNTIDAFPANAPPGFANQTIEFIVDTV